MTALNTYRRWLARVEDDALRAELSALDEVRDAAQIEDRFYRDLAFGTGGLRGVLGAGTNRMNVYVVRRATQGLAAYLKAAGLPLRCAIAYDSRIGSPRRGRPPSSPRRSCGWFRPPARRQSCTDARRQNDPRP